MYSLYKSINNYFSSKFIQVTVIWMVILYFINSTINSYFQFHKSLESNYNRGLELAYSLMKPKISLLLVPLFFVLFVRRLHIYIKLNEQLKVRFPKEFENIVSKLEFLYSLPFIFLIAIHVISFVPFSLNLVNCTLIIIECLVILLVPQIILKIIHSSKLVDCIVLVIILYYIYNFVFKVLIINFVL